jgi:hypothetical protein
MGGPLAPGTGVGSCFGIDPMPREGMGDSKGGMDMVYNEASNLWDAVKEGKAVPVGAENDEAFPVNEILTPEQKAQVLEIMDSLEKSRGWKTASKTEMSLRGDSDDSRHSIERGEIRAEDDEACEENAVLTAQNELNALIDHMEPKQPMPKEQRRQTDQLPSPPSHVPDLLNHTKHQLSGMKAFAAFAKDKFRDPELGMRYHKAFLRRIDETMSLLNSYADYLSLSNPTMKTDTINRLIEETLTQHREQLEDRQIEIIKKQFAENLPETTVPEAQLEYIFDSLMQYITHSTPPHGSLGWLTRLVDGPKGTGEENDPLPKDRKYIEVLFVFSTHDKKGPPTSSSHRGKGIELILVFVKELIEKNKGFIEVKPSDKNAMTFISLRVPAERRTVFQFKPLR